jgi:hypothetical protein
MRRLQKPRIPRIFVINRACSEGLQPEAFGGKAVAGRMEIGYGDEEGVSR